MLKNIRRTYILAVAVIGLLAVALYSTYAMFTANVDLADVSITPNVTLDAKLLEYEQLTIPKNEYKIIELNVANDYNSELHYGAWYEMINPTTTDNVIIAKYSESQDETSGTIGQNITKKIKVIIYNKNNEDITLNIGIGSNIDENLNLGDNRHIIQDTYTVVKANITPDNTGTLNTKEQVILQNSDAIFNVTPNGNYEISNVSCTGDQTASYVGNTVTVANVAKTTTCTITMKEKTYTVNASLNPSEAGQLDKNTQTVTTGQTATFKVTPTDGYEINNVTCTDNNNATFNGATVTVSNVTSDTTCIINMKLKTYTVYISADNSTIKDGTKVNNIVKNGSFEDGNANWTLENASVVTAQHSHGSKSLQLNGGTTPVTPMSKQTLSPKSPVLNHKYYGRLMFLSSADFSTSDNRYEWYSGDGPNKNLVFANKSDKTTSWKLLSNIQWVTENTYLSNDWYIRNFQVNANSNSYVDELMIIDLTDSFGSGNEPKKEWLDNIIPYFETSGSVSSSNVVHGNTTKFTITPDTGYEIDKYSCTNATITASENEYTISGINQNTKCNVTTKKKTYNITTTITPSNGTTVSPSSTTVKHGETSEIFKITPKTGYQVSFVNCTNGEAKLSGTNFTVENVTGNSECTITMELKSYKVSASVSSNGSVTPSSKTVTHGSNATFTVNPNDDYEIDKVTCSNNQNASFSGNTVTVKSVTNETSCTITMKKKTYTVTAQIRPQDAATVSGGNTKTVSHGLSTSFSISPNTDYQYLSVSGTGCSISGTTLNVSSVTEEVTCVVSYFKSLTQDITNLNYTGDVQIYKVTEAGYYRLEVWGAEGGYRSSSIYSGKGGYSYGTVYLEKDTMLYIYAGGSGNSGTCSNSICTGGFNGGGYRHTYKGGGGASDVRIGSDDYYSRVIVAGGGGSDGASTKKGQYGGGETGGSSSEDYSSVRGSGGKGGTQTYSGYSTSYTIETQTTTGLNSSKLENYAGGFGFGGGGVSYRNGYGGAGGGGWYGGSGNVPDSSSDNDRGGGGGSGFVYTSTTPSTTLPSGYKLTDKYQLTSAATIGGYKSFNSPSGSQETGHTGNGYVRITKDKLTVNVSVSPSDSANITGDSSKITHHGENIEFIITPKEGYKYFMAEGCTYDENTNTATVSNVTQDTTCIVRFRGKTNIDTIFDKCQTGGWKDNTEPGLYEDGNGNCRYVGAGPNNWIKFNDDMYQIIGIFNENTHGKKGEYLLKLIYPDILIAAAYGAHNIDETSGTYSNYSSDWTGSKHSSPSSAYLLLNEYFYNAADSSTKYGACENWTYFNNGNADKSKNCDTMVVYGIKEKYRNYIENTAIWYLYGLSSTYFTKKDVYQCERGGYNCTAPYEATTQAPIGLIYLTDYLYASGYSSNTASLTNSAFYYENWLYQGSVWVLSPYNVNSASITSFDNSYLFSSNYPYFGNGLLPTFYLKSDVKVTGGDGTFNNPYTISY